MGNAFITKGTTVLVGSLETDIKAIVIEDVPISTVLATPEKVTSVNGDSYSFSGEDNEANTSIPVIMTDDTAATLLTEIYGSPVVTTPETGQSLSTWNLKSAGSSNTALKIVTPWTDSDKRMEFTAVNPKGLGLTTTMVKNKGFEGALEVTCDYWQQSINTSS